MKYNSFLEIKKGDKIKFVDGTIKTIAKETDSHRVIFDDGTKTDLWIIKDQIDEVLIDGINESIPKATKVVPIKAITSYDDFEEFFIEHKSDFFKKPTSRPTEVTYRELFDMMENADKSTYKWSKNFWQYTHASTLAEIVKSGFFRSRYNVEGSIPYDIKEHNETEKDVQNTNKSKLTIRHVRFYLRLQNKPFFNVFINAPQDVKNNFAIVSIVKEALYKSNNSTFLYPYNAHSATDEVFDKEKQLNLKYTSKFKVYKLNEFDFKKIYSDYDKSNDDFTKWCQQAEFLVWKDLNIKFIDKIYFYTTSGLNLFLSQIRALPMYNEIKQKCFVRRDIFGY